MSSTNIDFSESFFSLIYSQTPPLSTQIDFSMLKKDSISIILAYNNRNSKIFLQIPLFLEILKTLDIKPKHKNIKMLQKSLLDFLYENSNNNLLEEILDCINTLKLKGVILYEEEQCLKTIFKSNQTLHYELKNQQSTQKSLDLNIDIKNTWFYQNIQKLQNIFQQTSFSKHIQNFIEKKIHFLESFVFEISICGISKSGKSALLNTLLYDNILPVSAIPETSSKITITYGNKPKGNVEFLSQKQWKRMNKNLYFEEDLKITMKEDQRAFGIYMENFIKENNLKIEVPPKEIKTYSSIEDPSKISYLVKEISIASPIKFLKNNIKIINTPNIDTSFNFKRHQTENAISNSIMTLYLINASKPLSLKDIEFLSNIIHYENLQKVLVVFTRADLMNLSDLKKMSEEILNAIKKTQNSNSKIFKTNLDKIDFIPVASTLALLHRTGKGEEAFSRGYDIEDTGILTLENYIYDIIFQHHNKYFKNLFLDTFEFLDLGLKIYPKEIKKEDLKQNLKDIKNHILYLNQNLIKNLNDITQDAEEKIKDLILNLKEHLLDFIDYEISKNKIIDVSRLQNTIILNLKDSLKYLIEKTQERFNKQMKFFTQEIKNHYDGLKLNDFESKILQNYQNLFMQIAKYKYSDMNLSIYTQELKKNIDLILRDGAKITEVKKNINKAFEICFENLINYLNEKMQTKKTQFNINIDNMIEELESIIIGNLIEENLISEEKKIKIQNQILEHIKNIKESK